MKEIYLTPKTEDLNRPEKHDKIEHGVWIHLSSPDQSELQEVSLSTGLPVEYLKAALDEEERPRTEFENGNTLIIIDTPEKTGDGDVLLYDTLPLGIVINEKFIVTVCLKNNSVLDEFREGKIPNCFTYKRTRFLLQLLYKNAQYFLKYLRIIDRETDQVEELLHKSMKNQELIELLDLEKSLVYFSTSLKANEVVLEKILKFRPIRMYEDDTDLLEDVIIENKQAIEMANIYSNILSGMMDAFASIINNNMNQIMKILASVTIILSIPTMISSFFGMNVPLPFQSSPNMTMLLFILSLLISVSLGIIMWKKEFI
ncbi:magnesium transporter [Methanomicrobium sp. W14]|uniref:magnesium transporter CorA family protein n=1 Tax=Methanomicrobium sp. W14 TaxID=2817839 RepID=UPI001AE812CA|nr:magnesium transporter CorA family protein [Methanomicrobium sp. W14]MBP2133754.1 magnesium transporter [Methanomicrobium sp. W14]